MTFADLSRKYVCTFSIFLGMLSGLCYAVQVARNNTSFKECIELCRDKTCNHFCYTSTDRSCVLNITVFECPLLAPPTNGNVSYPSGRYVQEQAVFTCALPYYLYGEGALMCLANGTWDGAAPSCETCLLPWTIIDGKCVQIFTGPGGSTVNWQAMNDTCNLNTASLIILHMFLVSDILAFAQQGACTGFTAVGATFDTTLGISNYRLEWLDGSDFQNVTWDTSYGEPRDLTTEECLWFALSSGLYYAGYCGGTSHVSGCFLCQKL